MKTDTRVAVLEILQDVGVAWLFESAWKIAVLNGGEDSSPMSLARLYLAYLASSNYFKEPQ